MWSTLSAAYFNLFTTTTLHIHWGIWSFQFVLHVQWGVSKLAIWAVPFPNLATNQSKTHTIMSQTKLSPRITLPLAYSVSLLPRNRKLALRHPLISLISGYYSQREFAARHPS